MAFDLLLDIGKDADLSELEKETRRLEKDLLALDIVEEIRRPDPGNAPKGAKGDPVTVGALIVALVASGGALPALLNVIQTRLSQDEKRTITIKDGNREITMTGGSYRQQEEMVKAFLEDQRNRKN